MHSNKSNLVIKTTNSIGHLLRPLTYRWKITLGSTPQLEAYMQEYNNWTFNRHTLTIPHKFLPKSRNLTIRAVAKNWVLDDPCVEGGNQLTGCVEGGKPVKCVDCEDDNEITVFITERKTRSMVFTNGNASTVKSYRHNIFPIEV
jgi:hypothetical protein